MRAPVTFVKRPSNVTSSPAQSSRARSQGLEHPCDAVLAGDAERLVLLVAVAERGVDDDAPVREHVHGRDVLGHLHRVLERDEDGGEQVHVAGLGADAGERDERLQHLEGVGEEVLAGVDVVESQVAGEPHEVQHVGEALHHVPVARVLEEPGEGESELHGLAPNSGTVRDGSDEMSHRIDGTRARPKAASPGARASRPHGPKTRNGRPAEGPQLFKRVRRLRSQGSVSRSCRDGGASSASRPVSNLITSP